MLHSGDTRALTSEVTVSSLVFFAPVPPRASGSLWLQSGDRAEPFLLQYFSTRGGIVRSASSSRVFLRPSVPLSRERNGLVPVHLADVRVPLCRVERVASSKLLDIQHPSLCRREMRADGIAEVWMTPPMA